MKLVHARIVTDDVPRLTRFYEAVTATAPIGDDRYVEFHAEELRLAISSQRVLEAQYRGATRSADNRSMILDFEVEDVDKEYARLKTLVGTFVLEPTDQPWGNRAALFRDPDGNLINLYAPIRRRG